MRIVACAVIEHEGKLLLCRRGFGVFPFQWELPGRELESDETLEDALEEHLFRELGVNVEIGKILYSFSAKVGGEEVLFYAMKAKILGGKFSLGMYFDASLALLSKLFAWNLNFFTRKILINVI